MTRENETKQYWLIFARLKIIPLIFIGAFLFISSIWEKLREGIDWFIKSVREWFIRNILSWHNGFAIALIPSIFLLLLNNHIFISSLKEVEKKKIMEGKFWFEIIISETLLFVCALCPIFLWGFLFLGNEIGTVCGLFSVLSGFMQLIVVSAYQLEKV